MKYTRKKRYQPYANKVFKEIEEESYESNINLLSKSDKDITYKEAKINTPHKQTQKFITKY